MQTVDWNYGSFAPLLATTASFSHSQIRLQRKIACEKEESAPTEGFKSKIIAVIGDNLSCDGHDGRVALYNRYVAG